MIATIFLIYFVLTGVLECSLIQKRYKIRCEQYYEEYLNNLITFKSGSSGEVPTAPDKLYYLITFLFGWVAIPLTLIVMVKDKIK